MIQFREAVVEDIPFILSVRNLKSTRRWLDITRTFTVEEGKYWFTTSKPKMYILSHDDEDIGYFRTSDWEPPSLCIGSDLHPDFRGKGLGKESYKTMMSYLHEHHDIQRFWLRVFSENTVALNLYKKLGFQIIDRDVFDGRDRLTMQLDYIKNPQA